MGGMTPFFLVVLASVVISTPWYRNYQRSVWEVRIRDHLGVRVRARDFEWTAPNQFHATDLEVRHPETGALMARVPRVDGLMKSKGWSLIIDSPILDGAQIEDGIQVLHDWFLCRPQTASHLVALAIPKGVAIHHASGMTQIERMEVLLRPSERTSLIQAKMTLADQPFGEVTLQVTRDHGPEQTGTSVELTSPTVWLPCAVVGERFPSLESLGSLARFRGTLRCNFSPHQWDAAMTGEVEQLDVTSATSAIGSPIRSMGGLRLEQLNVRDGKILRAVGEFHCAGGTAHALWLKRLAQQLALPSQWSGPGLESLKIGKIGCRFTLDAEGLVLVGLLPGPANWPPVAAQLDGAIVCSEPEPRSMTALVHALQAIPLSEDRSAPVLDASTASLSSVLPWPNEVQSPATSSLRSRLTKHMGDRSTR
jgi:hypothetical protein